MNLMFNQRHYCWLSYSSGINLV